MNCTSKGQDLSCFYLFFLSNSALKTGLVKYSVIQMSTRWVNVNLSLTHSTLKSSNLRKYYHTNILAFGELLHKIHPLAGQGFNMTIRDIKILSEIIESKTELGLHIDALILTDFEKQTRNKNFIFSSGIDFIYEFFNIEKKIKNKNITKILKTIGKNKNFTNLLIKFADRGINF